MSADLFAGRLRSLSGLRVGQPEEDPDEAPAAKAHRFAGREGGKVPLPPARVLSGEVSDVFFATVEAVRSTTFLHLSHEDIAHPPHGLFDAHLGRQIALHVMVERLGLPKRRVARDLERSREAINRALAIVDERLVKEEFSEAYETIASRAREGLRSQRRDQSS